MFKQNTEAVGCLPSINLLHCPEVPVTIKILKGRISVRKIRMGIAEKE